MNEVEARQELRQALYEKLTYHVKFPSRSSEVLFGVLIVVAAVVVLYLMLLTILLAAFKAVRDAE